MMRPGQGKQRMRGRHRGNKGGGGGNPLQRSYESNGPDVKIRGTAQHIIEKYAQLARDAQASDDHVLAESYLQHAEHYFRLIAAYQAQFAQNQGLSREDGAADDAEGDDEMNEGGDFHGRQHYQQHNRFQRNPYQRPENAEQPPVAFPQREEGNVAAGAAPREEGERERGPRRFDNRRDRPQRNERPQQGQRHRGEEAAAATGDEAEQLPSFLTRTRRRSRPQEENAEEIANNNTPVPPASEA